MTIESIQFAPKDGEASPAVLPYEGAKYVVADGACPVCKAAPLHVAGIKGTEFDGHNTVRCAAGCVACKARVGTLTTTLATLFGLEEDRAVLNSRPRVYGAEPGGLTTIDPDAVVDAGPQPKLSELDLAPRGITRTWGKPGAQAIWIDTADLPRFKVDHDAAKAATGAATKDELVTFIIDRGRIPLCKRATRADLAMQACSIVTDAWWPRQ